MLAWLFVLASLLPLSSADSHVLDVPYRNQLDGSPSALSNCGPSSLAMALGYYGRNDSTWDLRVRAMKRQHSWVDDEGGYSDRYGVFVYNLAAVAEDMGLHVQGLWLREGARIDRLRPWRADDLRREIAANHPVIVQVAYRALPRHSTSLAVDDHFIVVHGVIGDAFVYSDPLGNASGGPRLSISERQLMGAMDRAETPGVGFAVVDGKRTPNPEPI